MYEKRLKEILARKAEIKTELETADEARVAELDTEVEGLNTEEATIRSKLGVAGKLGAPVDAGGTDPAAQDGVEERAKKFRETRSVTITGGTLVQPKKTGDIKDGPVEVSSIVDLVAATPCHGMGAYEVPYVKSSGEGTDTTEGADVTDTDPEFGYADIKPGTITTYCEISREAMKLTDKDYLARVEQAARTALRKKVARKIVATAADANFTSIFNADACVTDVEVGKIDAGTLRTIAMNYGGDEAIEGNAVLILSKKDLVAFGDVRGTNEKKAVYEITPSATNPNTGIIKDGGLAVTYIINSGMKDTATASGGEYCMAYGVPGCFELGVFSDYEVIVDESAALKRRMVAILGEVMMGGNVVVYDGFIRVKKSA